MLDLLTALRSRRAHPVRAVATTETCASNFSPESAMPARTRAFPRAAALGLACAALATAASCAAAAEGAPLSEDRPVRIIVPFAAGGSTDVTFRAMQNELSHELGHKVIIENRPGGGATIGMNVVANSPPDGYTLGVATLSFAANQYFLGNRVPYNTQSSFVPVAMVARMPLVLTVNPSTHLHSAQELVAYNRAHPGKLNYGSNGIASSGHLGGALLESLTNTRMTHVPYSNSSVVTAVVGGDVQVLVGPVPSSLPFIQEGKLVALGVTSAKRVSSLPDVPTLEQAGIKGFEAYEWSGLVAPKGTPADVVQKINAAVDATLNDASVRQTIKRTGAEPMGGTPQQFASFLHSEFNRWGHTAAQLKARDKAG